MMGTGDTTYKSHTRAVGGPPLKIADRFLDDGLPADEAAERSILGAILLDEAACVEARRLLRPADFFLRSHRMIFSAMVLLSERGAPIDLVTLSAELRKTDEFDKFPAPGAATFISSLIDDAIRLDKVSYHAGLVLKKSALRQLIASAQKVITDAMDQQTEPEAIVEAARSRWEKIAVVTAPMAVDPFCSAAEMNLKLPSSTEWLATGFVAIGIVFELIGRVKEGKTTLGLDYVRAALTGDQWLGRDVYQAPVVLVTEQTQASCLAQLRRAGIADAHGLHILCRTDARNLSFKKIVELAVERAHSVGAKTLMIDSFSSLAGFQGDEENQNGTGRAAMAELTWAASTGLAIWSTRHAVKGTGRDAQDAGRGGSSISGEADILAHFKRLEGNQDPTLREIASVGRLPEIPDRLVIRFDPSTARYELLGDIQTVRHDAARAAILNLLQSAEAGLKLDEITPESGASRATVQRVLGELAGAGMVTKIGTGKRNDPARYLVCARTPAGLSGNSSDVGPASAELICAHLREIGLGTNQLDFEDESTGEDVLSL